MAKKLQKQKKGMSPKVKFTLLHSFKSLLSNQSCIDGSHDSPWWVAAIFFVFSVVIPLLPNFVRLGNVNGGSYLTSATFGLDKQMTAFAYDMKKEGNELKVKGDILHYYKDEVEDKTKFVNPNEDADYYDQAKSEWSYTSTTAEGTEYELRVFIWNLKGNALKKAVNKVAGQKFKRGTTDLSTVKEDKKYTPNIVVFTPQTFAVALYKYHTTTRANTTNGGLDWTNTSGKTGLINRMLSSSIKADKWTGNTPLLEKDEFINTYSNNTYKVLVKISNETYMHQRTVTRWQTTGIYAGIYAGVIVFLGLMVFVLTRGKNNPFSYLNIWHCQKITWWASASPAILGLIVSLIFGTNTIAQIAFVLLVSLRVMWLSMRQLRPVYNA